MFKRKVSICSHMTATDEECTFRKISPIGSISLKRFAFPGFELILKFSQKMARIFCRGTIKVHIPENIILYLSKYFLSIMYPFVCKKQYFQHSIDE